MLKKLVLPVMVISLLAGLSSCNRPSGEIQTHQLTCEYLPNPLGLDIQQPRLSWELAASVDGLSNLNQTAYQILAASSRDLLNEEDADLWNTGKVTDDQNTLKQYQGTPLESEDEVYWKVRVWDQQDQPGPWSEIAFWTVGLLDPKDWKASWIGDEPDHKQAAYRDYLDHYDPASGEELINVRPDPPASPMLRKTFTLEKRVEKAMLYISALGYYEAWMNGEKIGDQVLAPEWTNYHERVQYQTFDVTELLTTGANALTAVLADGWYLGMLGPTKWHHDYPRRGVYGNDRRLIAQLNIQMSNGESVLLVSDDTWRLNPDGFVLSADNFLGQTIDARKIPEGWKLADFDDADWSDAFVDTSIQKTLVAQKNEPVRIHAIIKPVDIKLVEGNTIVNFGQNLTGWTRLDIQGTAGQEITIRHGEMLNEDGSLYTANLAAAKQVDRYFLSGQRDRFEPRFTYHGFQYVEISGLTEALDSNAIVACAISSDPEVTGSFECSNPKLNKLWENILWTQRDNMTSIPTDCPQRDERMGWMGDAQVFCQTSIFNMNMAAFYTKWIKDIREAMSERGTFPDIAPHANKPDIRFSNAPAWADAGVIVPWRLYQNYGDTTVLRQHYPAMKAFLENIRRQNPENLWLHDVGNQYGDWLNANTIIAENYSNTRGEIPKPAFATAFYAQSTRLFSKMAEILGEKEDALFYGQLSKDITDAFNTHYVGDDARIAGNTQSAYAIALNFDLLPDELQDLAFAHLIECIEEYDYRISTGFISTVLMMKELSKRGRNDIAWRLIESERFPSWLYSINQGATTIWERWDGYVKGRGFQNPGMNSFNHYSIGAVGEWMYRTILGINPDDKNPGFRHIIIRPQPGGSVSWAKGSYHSIQGPIRSEWKIDQNTFTLDIEIPVGSSASVFLPGNDEAKQVGSGVHHFESTYE